MRCNSCSFIAEGHQNPEIAEALHITKRTVASHVERILRKLGARTRAEAVSVAYQRSLLPTAWPCC